MARASTALLGLLASLVLGLAPLCALADPLNDEQVAIAAQRNGDSDSALELFKSALDGYAAAGQFDDMARVAQSLLLLQVSLNQIEAAVATCRNSRSLLMGAGRPQRAAQITTQLASVLKSRGDYAQAEESCLAALDIYTAINDLAMAAGTLMSLGVILGLADESLKSADYFGSAGDYYMELGDERGLMQSYASRGQALLRADDGGGAEDSYRQALFLCGKLAEPATCAAQHLGLSRALRMQSNGREALEQCERALELFGDRADVRDIAAAHLERGRVLLLLERSEDALQELGEAWDGFAASGSINEQAGMADELIELARRNGRRDLAERYTRESDALNASS